VVLSALRGAVGFLTRLPVAADGDDLVSFAATPAAFPAVGYLVGALVALPLLVLEGAPAGFAYLLAVSLVVGVNHADGLADLGDAAVVHGDAERRRAVLKDSAVGVGAVLALGVALVGLGLAGLALGESTPLRAFGLAVAAEVGAKLGMAAVACFGTASHEGFGSEFTDRNEPRTYAGALVVALPALVLTPGSVAAALALLAGFAVALGLVGWSDAHLGGVNGDVFGATNELARVLALHAGLVVVGPV
jgi:adenosylcobinamide-GDP ribazoletransferase